MSVKGCIVCGQSLGRDEVLLCSDCVGDEYMQDTNKAEAYPIYIEITPKGPIDITETYLRLIDVAASAVDGTDYSNPRANDFDPKSAQKAGH